jgi:transposase InsO family protein
MPPAKGSSAASRRSFYPRDWRATTVDQFIEVVDSYIRWYNAKRIEVSLGSLSPVEYRQSLGIAA